MTRIIAAAAIFLLAASAVAGWAYPLDGASFTGILRLEGHRKVQQGKIPGRFLPPGARLPLQAVDLRLTDRKDLTIPEADPEFTRQAVELLGPDADRYQMAVLDVSDPEHPRYAEHRGTVAANPGSVGKLVAAVALFQALADIYPNDTEARIEVLRNTMVTADEFVLTDHHRVPFWKPGYAYVQYRPLKVGDTASLWTYLDWMMSASSNAAASMVIREVMLLNRFGRKYPVDAAARTAFFEKHPRKKLSELLLTSLQSPIVRNGLPSGKLQQGGFFTWKGKQKVPGTTSHASPRALIELLLKMEQGLLVDSFSSREIKRLLYMTQRRIRYASSPALRSAAVYFKSGSLYKCRPEPDFECGKYQGNVLNMLNSVAIVEAPAEAPKLFYMAAVMSNKLRVNSAVAHQTLATRLHRLIEKSRGGEQSARRGPQ